MSDDDLPFLEWSVSEQGDRALLTIQYDQDKHEHLWGSSKNACRQLLGFSQSVTACTVTQDETVTAISSFPESMKKDFEEEWCTLFQVEAPKIGNVSAVGKGDSKKKREWAGAIALIASAWLMDKANGTEVLRTIEKEPCSDMTLTAWKANLKVSTGVWYHENKTRINARRETIAMSNIVRQRIQKQLGD